MLRALVIFLGLSLLLACGVFAQVVECASACTVTVIHELSLPPLQLTLEEGGQIAAAVLAVWAVGFGVRVVVRVLRETDGNSPSSND